MKRFIIISICLFSIFSLTACNNSADNSNSADIASEVKINLPEDDSVNGYRNTVAINTASNGMPDIISGDKVSADSSYANSSEINHNVDSTSKEYCGNKNSKVFHENNCGSVNTMKTENQYFADRDTLISEGYKPCGRCNP